MKRQTFTRAAREAYAEDRPEWSGFASQSTVERRNETARRYDASRHDTGEAERYDDEDYLSQSHLGGGPETTRDNDVAALPHAESTPLPRSHTEDVFVPVEFRVRDQLDLGTGQVSARVFDALATSEHAIDSTRFASHRFAHACNTVADWSLLFGDDGTRWSLRLDPGIFWDARAVDQVIVSLNQAGIAFDQVDLRVPALAFAEHPKRVRDAARHLRALGIRLTALGLRELTVHGVPLRELSADVVSVSWKHLETCMQGHPRAQDRQAHAVHRHDWLLRFFALIDSLGVRSRVIDVDDKGALALLRLAGAGEAVGAAVGIARSASTGLDALLSDRV